MYITNIKLLNYRNYEKLDIDFENGLNVFVGNNAQGKTNLLEAIYVSSYGKSYRTSKAIELVNFDNFATSINLTFDKNDHEENIKIRFSKEKDKRIEINDIPIKKLSDLIGYLKVVTFKPEDLLLIKEGPGKRRKFLDNNISQSDNYYMQTLQNYNRALLQKNTYLKDTKSPNPEEINIWNNQLVKYGKELINLRSIYIEEINNIIEEIHSNITDGKEKIIMIYEPNVSSINIEEKINSSINNDIRLRVSNVGPHRDDFSFTINDIDVKKYGSQGQQRTSILSLLFSQIEYIKNKTGDTPILLLDDVLSELDEERQNKLIEYINKMQTILTCTEVKDNIKTKMNIKKMFKIKEGKVL